MQLEKHPILWDAYHLTQAIEGLGASELHTKVVVQSSKLGESIEKLIDELRQAYKPPQPQHGLRWAVWCKPVDGQRRVVGVFELEAHARDWADRQFAGTMLAYEVVESVVTIDHEVWPCSLEEFELGMAALKALYATVRQARAAGKYGPFDWLKETEAQQIEHADEHLKDLMRLGAGMRVNKPHEPHAEHALTRLVLLLALKARAPKPQS